MNSCKVCEQPCKNKFCSISCRNKFWNPILKVGPMRPGSKSLEKRVERKTYDTICIKCGKCFQQTLTEAQYKSTKYRRLTCSKHCSKSHKRSDESKAKTSKSLKAHIEAHGRLGFVKRGKPLQEIVCPACGEIFHSSKVKKFCSNECNKEYSRRGVSELSIYRRSCKFNFNPYHYPDILNTKLLDEFGFYSPSNKKNNLGGVSMDHKMSIRDGFDIGADPYYMSHIMNCQLLRHADNISKHRKSSITFDELKRLVDEYDSAHRLSS